MDLLENSIQPYAWGSRTAIAELRGDPVPSPGPQAELWMGAHPLAPSRLVRSGARTTLDQVVRRAPELELGGRALAEHGAQLPFLLKVLAAEQPLSIQAHPDEQQAREGFAREEAAGVPRDAPHRNYRDAWPKPELVCALTPFDALWGFRPAQEALAVVDALGTPALGPVRDRLAAGRGPEALREAFTWLSTLAPQRRAEVVDPVVAAAARAGPGPFAEAFAWTGRLAALYPGDPGVVVALLMRLVRLAPGEALFLPAGTAHAYLHGVGIEVMATSDNVLRGGLTPKHVDVPELLRVLRFGDQPVARLRATARRPGEWSFETPARHFELSRLEPPAGGLDSEVGGPELLLCTSGEITATDAAGALVLRRGASAFVPASTARYRLDGDGVVFRAALPRAG